MLRAIMVGVIMLNVIMLSVILLSVIMLGVVALGVVALKPKCSFKCNEIKKIFDWKKNSFILSFLKKCQKHFVSKADI